MDRLITLLCALILAGGVVFGMDRQPVWSFTVPAPVRWVLPASWKHPTFSSLASDRDSAIAGEAEWKASAFAFSSALKAQQAGVAALKAAGDVKLAAAAPLPQEARSGQLAALSRRDAVLAVKPVDDRCVFARSVDAAFMEGLK